MYDWVSAPGLKRFRSLVMDVKVIGPFREYPVNTDHVKRLVVANGLS